MMLEDLRLQLMNYLAEEVSKPEYQPKDEKTFCNLFTREVVNKLTGQEVFKEGLMANEMVEVLRYNAVDWVTLGNYDSITWASQCRLIIAAWGNPTGHGHVCVLYPSINVAPGSAKWNLTSVPWVTSVGAKIYAKIGSNWVFEDPPIYYRWQGDLVI